MYSLIHYRICSSWLTNKSKQVTGAFPIQCEHLTTHLRHNLVLQMFYIKNFLPLHHNFTCLQRQKVTFMANPLVLADQFRAQETAGRVSGAPLCRSEAVYRPTEKQESLHSG